MLKLYLLTQTVNTGYDTFDSIIVCAEDEEDAKSIDPYGDELIEGKLNSAWAYSKSDIICEELGIANENQQRGLILASFNAG